jgi:hypothetical protein
MYSLFYAFVIIPANIYLLIYFQPTAHLPKISALSVTKELLATKVSEIFCSALYVPVRTSIIGTSLKISYFFDRSNQLEKAARGLLFRPLICEPRPSGFQFIAESESA